VDHQNDVNAPTSDPLDPTGLLGELCRRLQAPRSFESALQEIVVLAREAVDGSSDVSLTLIDDGPGTAASTGDVAVQMDERQYASGWGPCLYAAEFGQTTMMRDASEETRWPQFVEAARELGIGSSLSVPIPAQQHITGALNIYATTPHAFSQSARSAAESFAGFAALSLAQAFNYTHAIRQAETLQEAMRSRAVIEQAKGILMAARQCTADDAFDLLVQLSQTQHRKLRDIAVEVVSRASRRSSM
jgi:GAF domain-containing protein